MVSQPVHTPDRVETRSAERLVGGLRKDREIDVGIKVEAVLDDGHRAEDHGVDGDQDPQPAPRGELDPADGAGPLTGPGTLALSMNAFALRRGLGRADSTTASKAWTHAANTSGAASRCATVV